MIKINGKTYSMQKLTKIVSDYEANQDMLNQQYAAKVARQNIYRKRTKILGLFKENDLHKAMDKNIDSVINEIIINEYEKLDQHYEGILSWALENNRNETLKLLLKYMPDHRADKKLYIACKEKNSTAIKMILDEVEPAKVYLCKAFRYIQALKTHNERQFYIDIFLERDKLRTIKAMKECSINYKEYINV